MILGIQHSLEILNNCFGDIENKYDSKFWLIRILFINQHFKAILQREIKRNDKKIKLSQHKGVEYTQTFLKEQKLLEENFKNILPIKNTFYDELNRLKIGIWNLLNKPASAHNRGVSSNESNNQNLEYLRNFLESRLNNLRSEMISIDSM